MSFAHPSLLALLSVALFLPFLRLAWRARLRSRLATAGTSHQDITLQLRRERVWLRETCLCSALICAVLASAGPRWGSSEELRSARGANIVLLLDCSRSMLASDMYPNRLEAARRKALSLLRAVPEHRMALLPFAGIATLRTPFTGDHQAIDDLLAECAPDLFPAELGYQGTAISTAVRTGLALPREDDRGQAILILSDGDDPNHEAVGEAGKQALAAGIPIYGIFFGDAERTSSIDIDGRQQVVAATRETLDQLATATGGLSLNATTDDADLEALRQHLDAHLHSAPWEERRRLVASERYQWPLLAALVFAALAWLIPVTRHRELAHA